MMYQESHQDNKTQITLSSLKGKESQQSKTSPLYRKLRLLISDLVNIDDTEKLVTFLLDELVNTSREEDSLILGGRAYHRLNGRYQLFYKVGDAGPVPLGYEVPAHYAPVQVALKQGWVLMRSTDEGFDPSIEEPIGADTFAAIVIGPHHEFLLSFTLKEPVPDDELIFTLLTLRQITDLALRQKELTAFIEQARIIQTSLLPKEPPVFPGFEIVFRTRPAEIVGGDVYDFIRLSEDILGVCIGDATGHGLPAALQARDVIIGLRMGVEENLKIVKTMEKLARVINQTSLTSRYISLFYAEIERRGFLVYCNAGHVPPVIIRASGSEPQYLHEGGPVIGLPIRSHYVRSFAYMEPGDILLMYTDGLTETRNERGEEFGLSRLIQIIHQNRQMPLDNLIDHILQRVDEWGQGLRIVDDQTLILIRRKE